MSKPKLFHSTNTEEILANFFLSPQHQTKENKRRTKGGSANSRREDYCLQQRRKSTLFYINEAFGPFNPWQHSLVRYLFSAHQSFPLAFSASFFFVMLFASFFVCAPTYPTGNGCGKTFFPSPSQILTAIVIFSNFTNQWKSFNFDENHLISLRPFASQGLINFLLGFFVFFACLYLIYFADEMLVWRRSAKISQPRT